VTAFSHRRREHVELLDSFQCFSPNVQHAHANAQVFRQQLQVIDRAGVLVGKLQIDAIDSRVLQVRRYRFGA
jgi:hypothetical protein